jgi:hypothetical protein
MAFKRRAEPTTVEDERAALRAQHAALEDLKRQLNERVEAVRERELELHHAIAEANSQPQAHAAARPLPPPLGRPVATGPALSAAEDTETSTGEDSLEAERRERALGDRERAIAAAEVALLARTRQAEQDLAAEREQLAARERELEERQAGAQTMVGMLVPVPEPAPAPPPDAERLAQIEARLAELRDAEKMFLRTRDELAARSEAVAARERLVSQKERELDDREDGVGQWASPELTEMEARLRRLEQQQDPSEQTMGFSGGLRKLQQGTTRPPQREDQGSGL